ncbi:hypothetical protein V6N13_020222 [Hibiscus sabdariffa]
MRALSSDTKFAKKATLEHCKAITTRSGKQLKEGLTTNQGDKAPAEPSAAATHENTTSTEKDDIDPEYSDDPTRVDIEVDKDVSADDASATDAAATQRSDSCVKKS